MSGVPEDVILLQSRNFFFRLSWNFFSPCFGPLGLRNCNTNFVCLSVVCLCCRLSSHSFGPICMKFGTLVYLRDTQRHLRRNQFLTGNWETSSSRVCTIFTRRGCLASLLRLWRDTRVVPGGSSLMPSELWGCSLASALGIFGVVIGADLWGVDEGGGSVEVSGEFGCEGITSSMVARGADRWIYGFRGRITGRGRCSIIGWFRHIARASGRVQDMLRAVWLLSQHCWWEWLFFLWLGV